MYLSPMKYQVYSFLYPIERMKYIRKSECRRRASTIDFGMESLCHSRKSLRKLSGNMNLDCYHNLDISDNFGARE